MRKFRNIENGEVLTLEDLRKWFNTWINSEDSSAEEKEIYGGKNGFAYYLNNCMTYNNGVLEEIR